MIALQSENHELRTAIATVVPIQGTGVGAATEIKSMLNVLLTLVITWPQEDQESVISIMVAA